MRSKIISVVLCLGVILAVVLVPAAPPPRVALAQANDWGFEIQPAMNKKGFNEDFTVNAMVTWYAGASDGYVMYVQFNGALLDVTAVDTPATLPNGAAPFLPGPPTWDNTTGWVRVEYAKWPGSANITQAFTYCTIHFRTGSVPGTSYLNFTTIDPVNITTVMLGGTDYLNWTQVVNGTVMVGTILTVNVTPAGMGDVDISGASIPPSYPNATTRAWDAVVNLEAVNSTPGWGFVNWTGNLTGSTSPTSITMDDCTKNVTANFVEQSPAILAVPASLTFNANVGEDPANQTLQICNDGGYILNWTANITDGNVTWLSMSPMNGSDLGADDCNSTQVAVDITGLAQGTYYANITISGVSPPTAPPGGIVAQVAPVNVPVILNLGVPAISVSPTPLTFTTNEGVNPPSQTLEVCNSGTGTLDWSLSDGGCHWLSETPMSGSLGAGECEDVIVSVEVNGMEAGAYTCTITFTGSLTVSVPVNLNIVSAMPAVPVGPAQLSASALDITPQQVQSGQEVTISINVANTGGETGSYYAVLYINGVVEASQSVSVAGGISKNVIFTVTKTKAGVYDVALAGQNGQFEVVGGGGWFGGDGLGTGGIIAIVVIVIILIAAVIFILKGTTKPE